MSDNKRQIDKLVDQIESLPTLPVISQKIMEIAGKEDSTIQDMAFIIEKDQALATKVLKIANSSFYGFLSRISSLEHALALLGDNEVKAIVLGASVYNFFSNGKESVIDRGRFWKHAIICSQVAKYLATHFEVRNNDALFLSGLIHDMGKVVLDQYFHDEFVQIVDYIASEHTSFSKAEKKIIGTTHYQIGAKLLKQWKFPKHVIMQVFYHHAPWYDKNDPIQSIIIYLANIFTKASGYNCHPEEKSLDLKKLAESPEISFVVKSGFDLDYEGMKKLITNIQEYILNENDNVMRLFD